MLKNFIVLLSILFLIPLAQAGTLLEPYSGLYVNSTGTNNLTSCTSGCTESVSGSAVGARLGFQNLGLMLGLNGKRSWYSIEDLSDTYGDGVTTTLGFFAGYDFPILLRVWFEYVFSGDTVWEKPNDLTWKVENGTTLGIGYKVFPFISLNLEIGKLNYSEADNSGTASDIDFTINSYLLSVSIPLSL